MRTPIVIAGMVAAALALSSPARAQGIPGGAAHGAAVGNNVAGPVGAVVGGVVGGAIGGVEGALGVDRYGYAPQQAYAAPPPAPVYRTRRIVRERTYVEPRRRVRARARNSVRYGRPHRMTRQMRHRRSYE